MRCKERDKSGEQSGGEKRSEMREATGRREISTSALARCHGWDPSGYELIMSDNV